jgi:hypothetical protein
MIGSPSAILTLGYGNGSFVSSPSLVLSMGYGIGEQGETNIGTWAKPIVVRAFTGPIVVRATTTVKING